MNCAECGAQLWSTEEDLCRHHTSSKDSDWALSNRIWCEFLHRGRPIERVADPDLFIMDDLQPS